MIGDSPVKVGVDPVFGGLTAATEPAVFDLALHRPIPTPVARKRTAAAAAPIQTLAPNLRPDVPRIADPPPYTTRGPAARCA
jgi:hypothetical protein